MQAHTHTRRKHVWRRRTPPKPYPPETKLAEALSLTMPARTRGPGMIRLEKVDPKAELKGQGPRSICMNVKFSGLSRGKTVPSENDDISKKSQG